MSCPTPAYPSRQAREILGGLQGLRGLAAILVVCAHAICTLHQKAGAAIDLGFTYALGGLGVQTFFAISGLSMMLAHGNDFALPGASQKFAMRRLGRIVPLYWMTSLIYYLKLAFAHSAPGVLALLLSLGFIPHQEPGQNFGSPVYGLGWTLQFEMFFYFMFTIALCFRRRVALIGMALFFAAITTAAGLGLLSKEAVLGYLGSPIVLFFVAGMVIGVVRELIGGRGRFPWGFWTSVGISLVAIASAVASVATFGAASNLAKASSVAAALLSVLACGLARPEPTSGLFRNLAKALGDATYAIYLTHSFVLGPAGTLAGKYAHELPRVLFVTATVPLCTYIGWLVFRFVDGPSSKWFGNWLYDKLIAKESRSATAAAPVNAAP
jgi:exopolysaccharide production protein ExoZ